MTYVLSATNISRFAAFVFNMQIEFSLLAGTSLRIYSDSLTWGWYPMTLMHLGSTKVMTPSELCLDKNSVGTDMPFMSMHTGELVTYDHNI